MFNLRKLLPLLFRLKVHNELKNPYCQYMDINKVIFIHIPKAGGNSITKSLFNCLSTGHFYCRHYFIRSPIKYRNYYKFTVTRCPYSRFVSAFNYLKKGGMNTQDLEFSKEYLKGINNINDFSIKIIDDYLFRTKISAWTHFVPQYKFLTIFGRVQKLNRVVQIENIDKDLDLVAQDLNLNFKNLAHENKNSQESLLLDINKNIIAGVNLLYAKDFEILGYEKR